MLTELQIYAAQMCFLRPLSGTTELDYERNIDIRKEINVSNIFFVKLRTGKSIGYNT
jgi:hypothetical protein